MNITLQEDDGLSIEQYNNDTNLFMIGEDFDSSNDMSSLSQSSSYSDSDVLWMVMWVVSLIIFVLAPFCVNERRRTLCLRRILERRWISSDEMDDDDWYFAMIESRRQQAREQVAAEQAANQTKEDEIRAKFLDAVMRPYTMTVAKSDILDVRKLVASSAMDHLICQPSPVENAHELIDGSILKDQDIERQTPDHEDSGAAGSRSCDTSSTDDKETEKSMPLVARECECASTSTNENPGDEPAISVTNGLDNPISKLAEQMLNPDSADLDDNTLNNLTDTFEDGESPEVICVPLAGRVATKFSEDSSNGGSKSYSNQDDGRPEQHRHVLNGCTICLTRIVTGEQVTWSSNTRCLHIFHYDCILNWFLAVGRKAQQRRLRDGQHQPDPNNSEHRVHICTFPMVCPCCRQKFVMLPENINSDHTESPSFDESYRDSGDGGELRH